MAGGICFPCGTRHWFFPMIQLNKWLYLERGLLCMQSKHRRQVIRSSAVMQPFALSACHLFITSVGAIRFALTRVLYLSYVTCTSIEDPAVLVLDETSRTTLPTIGRLAQGTSTPEHASRCCYYRT